MTDPRDSTAATATATMPETRVRGRFLWHELMTTDTRAGSLFYTRLVGWTLQSWEENPSYQMFLAAGVPMAGLTTLPEEAKVMGAPPGWLGYIGSPDADETARLAVRIGGKVLKDTLAIAGVGRFVILQDPHGAVFAAFTPEQDPVGDDQPGLGDFSWHELATTDGPAAFDFYRRLFGWEKTDAMDMGPGMGVYQMFGANGVTLGGIYKIAPGAKYPPAWLPYALVPSSEKVATLTATLGGTVINGPMDVPGGDSIVQLLDPQGGMFAVHSKGTAASLKQEPDAGSKAVAGERAPARKSRASRSRTTRKSASAVKRARKARPAKKRAVKRRAAKRGSVRVTSKRRGRAARAKVRGGKRTARRSSKRGAKAKRRG